MISQQVFATGANHYINGQWLEGEGEHFTSVNPIDNSIIWQGYQASTTEVIAASTAAHNALAKWSSLRFDERAKYTERFAHEIEKRRQELAYLIALETGKPLWEAHTEVTSVSGKVALSIKAYKERNAEIQTTTAEANACLRFKPHGVAAVLGAFNFPAHLSNGHIIPALLAGNTIVYKPSELAPAVAQFMVECWHQTGLPAGVINCIQGDATTAKALMAADIQALYFTGSYQTGKQIHQFFSAKPEILLALEMGGNNPLIIDDMENTDAAIYLSILSTMITAGQRCTCARRIFIPNNAIGDNFLCRFIKACQQLQVGPFTNKPEPFMGPVIRHTHALNHLKSQQRLIDSGGTALLPMHLLAENTGLLSPGIVDMSQAKQHLDEEIFAPLVQVYRYDYFDEALVLANRTRYGLAAALFSDNPTRYKEFFQAIRAGLINWNRPTTGAVSSLPFGGTGCSGNHRPSAYFAADYCAYPIASLEQTFVTKPEKLLPGIRLD